MNDRIRARTVRLIGADGENLGDVPLPTALARASEVGLDLVEVGPNGSPPVCRLMDWGKHTYEQQRRKRAARDKAQAVKEVQIRPRISEHDLGVKLRRAGRFLSDGHVVKVVLYRMGRTPSGRDVLGELTARVAEELSEVGELDGDARVQGRAVTLVVRPRTTTSTGTAT